MSSRLEFTPAALGDLTRIQDYLDTHAPQSAQLRMTALLNACDLLRTTPRMGVSRPELGETTRLVFVPKRFIVAYELKSDTVSVLRIFAAGEHYEAALSLIDAAGKEGST